MPDWSLTAAVLLSFSDWIIWDSSGLDLKTNKHLTSNQKTPQPSGDFEFGSTVCSECPSGFCRLSASQWLAVFTYSMFHCPCDDNKLLRLFWWLLRLTACRYRQSSVFLVLPVHSWWCEGMGVGGHRVEGRDESEAGQNWWSVCRSSGMKAWWKDWSELCIAKWNHRWMLTGG